jgi:hypothetical protein
LIFFYFFYSFLHKISITKCPYLQDLPRSALSGAIFGTAENDL